jgi:hypothetical protein
MKYRSTAVALALIGVLVARGAAAQTATQTVAFEVQAINQISVTGSPSLIINSASAGGAPTAATASASYDITTNGTNEKITAQLDTDMPTGVTLSASLAAPSTGTSAGAKSLSQTTAQDMVTGISTESQTGLAINYTLNATAAAGVVPAGTRTVTYTITAGP